MIFITLVDPFPRSCDRLRDVSPDQFFVCSRQVANLASWCKLTRPLEVAFCLIKIVELDKKQSPLVVEPRRSRKIAQPDADDGEEVAYRVRLLRRLTTDVRPDDLILRLLVPAPLGGVRSC